ncbi:hypothetical protein GIB67_022384 [Kingdonia uniflora]|uniref:Uncharacterized protein n=1 Tax=Kingdonia uniflora TaxID=39325 RepID=A0A7J7MTZ3_9MAGN|nr:hypothetical protein GIB67_022384 [Kingdonia uniflora]
MPKLISSNQGALLKGFELVKILVGSGDGDLNKKKIASSGKNSLAERTVPVFMRSIQVITDSIIRAACIQVLFSTVYHLKSAILPHSSDLLTLSMKALQKGKQKEKMAAIKLLVLEEFLHIVQAISCTLYRLVLLHIVQEIGKTSSQWGMMFPTETPERHSSSTTKEIMLYIKGNDLSSLGICRFGFWVIVELELAHLSEEEIRQCNQEFTTEFDRMIEANEDWEDQHVSVHFKFIENEALMLKSREAGLARYRIQALETPKEELCYFVASLKNQMISKLNEKTRANLLTTRSELERLKNKMTRKDNELKKAQDDLSNSEIVVEQLVAALPTKDTKFRFMQRKLRIFKFDPNLMSQNYLARPIRAPKMPRL